MRRMSRAVLFLLFVGLLGGVGQAETPENADVAELKKTVQELAARVSVLEEELHRERGARSVAESGDAARVVPAAYTAEVRHGVEDISSSAGVAAYVPVGVTNTQTAARNAAAVLPSTLPGGATLNYQLDGYYGYDFNHPIGRVEYLRAYDVLSNAFSINQAGVVLALDPDVAAGRRYGVRLDLQFGQATETLQGSPQNEPRPEIYRNIFQAYGTYVVPLGKGLTVDVGKWSSSLGIEGNYTKDQMNYSRSFYFDYLPFYHAGVRASYKVNDRLTANYWLVNGTDQSEPTNSYKDELFGWTAQPTKKTLWNFNYYVGQDHPDAVAAAGCAAPVQPGLCLQQVNPAPDGKTHIFDSYVTWNATPKLTFAVEGDYVIARLWRNAAPGESSAPSHVSGGAAYARYQMRPRMAVAARSEYLSDRGGLFSGTTQALKEFTGTYEYRFGEGFLTRVEYRRVWSNVPFFLTNRLGVLAGSQPTLTMGMVWWSGGKQGVW